MAVTFQCDRGDLREAYAANGVWTRLDAKADRLSTWVGRAGSVVMFGWIIAMSNLSDRPGDHTWRVSPLALISSALMLPGFAVVVGMRTLTRARAGARLSSGIVRATVGKTSEVGKKSFVALAVWGVVLLLLAATFYLRSVATPRPVRTNPLSRVAPRGFGTTDATDLSASTLYLLIVAPSSIILIVLGLALRRARLGSIARGSPQFFRPQTFQVDDEGFTLLDADGHVRRRWAGLRRFVETKTLILLYTTDVAFLVVPKRCLQGNEDLDTLLVLLTRNVPSGVVQPRTVSAFPVHLVSTPPIATSLEP